MDTGRIPADLRSAVQRDHGKAMWWRGGYALTTMTMNQLISTFYSINSSLLTEVLSYSFFLNKKSNIARKHHTFGTVPCWLNATVTLVTADALDIVVRLQLAGTALLMWRLLFTNGENLQTEQWQLDQLNNYWVLIPNSRHKMEQRPFLRESVGGWRKDEFQWMSLALVGDGKAIWPQTLCTSYPSWNVLSLHSSSFIAVPSPVWEEHSGILLNRIYRKGDSRAKPANPRGN